MFVHHPLSLGKNLLAAQAQALEELQVALIGRELQVIKKLPAACNHPKKAATCGVVLRMDRQVLRQFVNTGRQDRDLHVGAAGVFFVQFEFFGACGSFAHGRLKTRHLVRRVVFGMLKGP